MKKVIENSSHQNIENLYTNGIVLNGYEIGTAMLPQLVHRTTLSPVIDGDEVDQRQYYTLHNDAGVCVFVSPHLDTSMFTRWNKINPKINPTNEDEDNNNEDEDNNFYGAFGGCGGSWSSGPGKKGNVTDNSRSYNKTDISYLYHNSSQRTVQKQTKREWRNHKVVRAVGAWLNSAIEKYSIPLPKCEDCSMMFKDAKELISFYAHNVKRATNVTGMFENCINLKKFGGDTNTFYGKSGDKIFGSKYCAKMFKGSGLTEITLNLPAMLIGNEMFSGCDSLTSVCLMIPNCTKMDNMFYKCTNLGEVRFPHYKSTITTNYLDNVTSAVGAFYNCLNLVNFTVPTMNSLIDGEGMFAQCMNLAQIETRFEALEKGNDMYINCTKLTKFTTEEKAIFPQLKYGRRMFRYCINLEGGQFTEDSFPVLEDGHCMFDSCEKITQIPCAFPQLKNARQLFRKCGFEGHLELDMPTYFPQVGTSDYENSYPTAYMFGFMPITSVGFDVSTLNNGISMFHGCTSLTSCTSAAFMQGGDYQSMFSESKFDETSTNIIINAAKNKVKLLHIGADSSFKTVDFQEMWGFTQLNEGDDSQWRIASGYTDSDGNEGSIIIVWN